LQFPWVDPRTGLKGIVEKALQSLLIEQEIKLKAWPNAAFPGEKFSKIFCEAYHADQRNATKKSQNPLKKLQYLTKFCLPADLVLASKPV
jgi:hypothetical protein